MVGRVRDGHEKGKHRTENTENLRGQRRNTMAGGEKRQSRRIQK